MINCKKLIDCKKTEQDHKTLIIYTGDQKHEKNNASPGKKVS